MEENTSIKRSKANNRKSKKKLPWWIELLFVQIGLPEKILVKLLDLDKKFKLHINQWKYRYKIIFLISIVSIYLYPIIEESSNHNKCVSITYEKIKYNKDIDLAKAIANNFCNGGDANNILN